MHLPTLRLSLRAAVVTFVADQATKAWALSVLWPPYRPGMEVLPMLNLRLGFNAAVAFGMFRDSAGVPRGSSSQRAPLVIAFLARGSGESGRTPRSPSATSSTEWGREL